MELKLRHNIHIEEFDYVMLKSALKNYKNPRVKINDLLKRNEIIRVKKGLYVFSSNNSTNLYIKETLANLIYGPSYISMEYALSFYGIIPERTETITNVTNKRNKMFETPIGRFAYKYINPELYSFGITQIEIDNLHRVLIATEEKAIVDLLHFSKSMKETRELESFIFNDMRFDENQLKRLNKTRLKQLSRLYSGNVALFYMLWEKIHE